MKRLYHTLPTVNKPTPGKSALPFTYGIIALDEHQAAIEQPLMEIVGDKDRLT
ncbi:MAG TPA: hypothetical protein VII92_15865 [Anaerolineae bacterium]